MWLLWLFPLVIADPTNIQLSISSSGHIEVRWDMHHYSYSFLVYGRLSSFTDISQLAQRGRYVKSWPKLANSGIKHKAEVKDLQPEELYVYQVGSEDEGWSPIYSFVGPIKSEEHYPTFAILSNLSEGSQSSKILSQLVARSFIERLDGIFIYGAMTSQPLYDVTRTNIPTMLMPKSIKESYYSIQYSHVYLIILNTYAITPDQFSWLKRELNSAQSYAWTIIFGEHPLSEINTSKTNFTELFLDAKVNLYVASGEFYERSNILYRVSDHQIDYTAELLEIQMGPSCTKEKRALDSNDTEIYASLHPGYGILHLRYSFLRWQEYSSNSHRLMDDAYEHRVGLVPRKGNEKKTVIIVLVTSFVMFSAAFIQSYYMRRRNKKKQNGLIDLDKDVVD
ncbi:unnamed protein product [Blepharisma stoltei]|uniref:Purple acid phosphatase N-terminal domain-containing protein n=1 Tax=Blepharisma stoltei TaxID=1481888 RepID=A0AAU9KB76_9CILI|nr:unnamed protein product [Blepharisma stoltei]